MFYAYVDDTHSFFVSRSKVERPKKKQTIAVEERAEGNGLLVSSHAPLASNARA
jgi:hypothetical protein